MNVLQIKRSAVAGRVPTLAQLIAGELGINTADKKLYFGTGSTVEEVAKKSDAVLKSDNALPLQAATMGSGILSTVAAGVNVLDSVSTAVTGMEYTIQGSSAGGLQMSKLLILFDGTTPHILEYGSVVTATQLYTVTAVVNGAVLEIRLTVANAVGTYKFVRTVFN